MKLRVSLSVLYVALAVAANWLASKYHWTVPLTSYVAPAGVFCVGIILVLRDWLQQLAGLRWTLWLVGIGGVASYLIGEAAGWTTLQKIAVASLVAFLLSETLEALIFTPLRGRRLTLAVVLSATVGSALDSVVFLWLAFGSLAFFPGNFVGKVEMIALGGILTASRRLLFPASASAARSPA